VARVYDNKLFSSKKWLRDLKREEKAHASISAANLKSSSKIPGVVRFVAQSVINEQANITCRDEVDSTDTNTHNYKDGYTMLTFDLITHKPTSQLLI
jgi:hypothetical protein